MTTPTTKEGKTMNALSNQIRMAQMGLCVSDAATAPQEPWPCWATGPTTTLAPGAQLCTKDGRKVGNAVITGEAVEHISGRFVWPVTTDAGNTLYLNDSEIDELFWPPQWLMDPATAPGEIKATLLAELKKAQALIEEHLEELCAGCTNLITGVVDNAEDLMAVEAEQDLLNSIEAAIAKAEGGAQ